jgi:hypothetical protein
VTLAQGVDLAPSFLQYGAIGLFALCASLAAIVLFRIMSRTLDIERETNAQLRAEIKGLNDKIQTQILTTLGETTRTMSDFLMLARREK